MFFLEWSQVVGFVLEWSEWGGGVCVNSLGGSGGSDERSQRGRVGLMSCPKEVGCVM